MSQNTLTLLAAGALLCAMPVSADKIDRNFHETFDVEPGASLHLVHGDGDVRITPWDQDVIDVEVRYRADMGGVVLGGSRDLEVEFRQSGDVVHVIAKEEGFTVAIGYSRTHEYTYTIKAPAWVALDLEGDDGDVRLRDWTGDIQIQLDDGDLEMDDISASATKLRLQDGDVELNGISGDLEIHIDDGDVRVVDCDLSQARVDTEDGDVDFVDCAGRFEVTSDDGDVDLSRVRAEEVSVRTQDGTVEAELEGAGSLRVEIQTDDGDVILTLDPEISADFEIQTGDGGIHLDLDRAEDVVRGRRRSTGRIGSGEGSIRVSTQDGSVRLRDGFGSG